MNPQRFRKKPVEVETVEAMRWDGSEESQAAIVNWGSGLISGWFDSEYFLEIREPGVVLRVNSGDWVICANGHFFPCSPDIFEATYEPVLEQGARYGIKGDGGGSWGVWDVADSQLVAVGLTSAEAHERSAALNAPTQPEPVGQSVPEQGTDDFDKRVEAAALALYESVPTEWDITGPAWLDDPDADEWADWAATVVLAAFPQPRSAAR